MYRIHASRSGKLFDVYAGNVAVGVYFMNRLAPLHHELLQRQRNITVSTYLVPYSMMQRLLSVMEKIVKETS